MSIDKNGQVVFPGRDSTIGSQYPVHLWKLHFWKGAYPSIIVLTPECQHVYAKKGLAINPRGEEVRQTAIVSCVPSEIQTRQWFVTNYSNISSVSDHQSAYRGFTIFSLDWNFAR